jgi:hypothetical protein
MTQDAVRSQFGTPEKQLPAVGNPPISRWVYKDFTVYFEGNVALHSVLHARALAQPQADSAVTELPPIEEIGETPSADAPAAETPEATPTDAAPAEEAAPAENTFRFDPVSGRIIEIGPDGQPVAPRKREVMTLAPMAIIVLVLGFWPRPLLNMIDTTSYDISNLVNPAGATQIALNAAHQVLALLH